MPVNVVTIQYLKTKRKELLKKINEMKQIRLCECGPDTIQNYDFLIGEINAYEDLINYMKGING